MNVQPLTKTVTVYRNAGWSAIVSGVIGLIAIGSLLTGVGLRSSNPSAEAPLAQIHDGLLIVQYLLLIGPAFALYSILRKNVPDFYTKTPVIAIGSICFLVIVTLLAFPKIIAPVVYMFPQGIFGAWLIFINWRMKSVLPKALRWFGIIVGTGLIITGCFVPGYAIFVDKIIIQIPAAPDELVAKVPINTANQIMHQFLFIGTFMGVLPFPVWSIFAGRQLLRKQN